MDTISTELTLELTSRCTLKCPRCTRTHAGDQLKIQELDIDLIKLRFTKEVLSNVRHITLSGIYGDAIYHTQLHEVVKYFKELDKRIMIETNGSYRKADWWSQLAELLGEEDTIRFSIDGLEDTNHLYRKGSDWESIILGAKICNQAEVYTQWKMIIFSHNEHQIEQAKNYAKEIGFDTFVLVRSNRFASEGEDPLRPSEGNYKPKSNDVDPTKIHPKCASGTEFFISSDGHLYPCCWSEFSPTHGDTFFIENKKQLSLQNYSVSEILQSDFMNELKSSFYTKPKKFCSDICAEKIKTTKTLNSMERFHF